jgi:hypothetical protein
VKWVVPLVLFALPLPVVAHDFYSAISFDDFGLLCQRDDSTYWRDPSNGCTGGNDTRCRNGGACPDSVIRARVAVTLEPMPNLDQWEQSAVSRRSR